MTSAHVDELVSELDAQLSRWEAEAYRSLMWVIQACDEIAAQADAFGLVPQAIRARLLASDARSRQGMAEAARVEQLALHEAAQAWPALAGHAATYLASSCDRLGYRAEAMRWVEASMRGVPNEDLSAWHAEALMVAALFSTSRAGADYTLVHQAMAAVRAACLPAMMAATAANFAEVCAECGGLGMASHFTDEAEAIMRRHPEAASALSWESVARARLALSELASAERACQESLRLEEQLGCCDVNGDPWLSCAEVALARGDAAGALAMLEHPRRRARDASSAWTNARDLDVRARVMAGLRRWEEAYQWMVRHVAAYEQVRSIEGDRAVAESSQAVAVDEARRQSRHFEQLAMTDPLTGLPNRRHAERWLAEHADAPLSLAIADLDHFKRINDTCSHAAGDLVLQRFGAMLNEVFNRSDSGPGTPMLAARLGGEEFLLAWCGIPCDAAMVRGDEIRERLRATSFTDIAGDLPVTASLGLAFGTPPVNPSELLRTADLYLYQAKHAGRDTIVGPVRLRDKAG
ncbi:MAG TPA: GGDEF domain-containing protein [Ideonella sp.]|uniref:GGDEF domain-containing protein n=1 Tax=Ideonella sp. TaxID=1929293 RepID=UPI002B6DEF03|nr:GGDEF domain-containing protein [Ideonella sp.]HSI50407.1 GGDEF domain-containing protein [Ideonella sp.]